MKTIITSLILVFTCFSAITYGVEDTEPLFIKEALCYGNIDGKGLKVLIDTQTPMVLFDARGTWWKDPNVIPGAVFASYAYSFEEIESMIPYFDSLIVVYCYSSSCPLANNLINYLMEMGYSNIIKYPGGLSEWRDVLGYPVTSAFSE